MVIDLLIIGFACLSLVAFVGTKDKKEPQKTEEIQKEEERE